jgi:hypothetical protein
VQIVPWILAAARVEVAWKEIIIACSILIGLLIVLWIGVSYYRRTWLYGQDDSAATPWTLEGLRQLREEGAISEDEYKKMRAAVIGAVRSEVSDSGEDGETPDNSETTEK